MSTLGILLTLTVLAAFSYYIGRKRSLALATPVKRGGNDLHSLPSYYGYLVVIWAIIPALLVFVLWSSLEKPLLTSSMMSHLPAEYQDKSADELSLTTNRIHNLADDPAQMATAEPVLKAAAEEYQQMRSMSQNIKTLLVLALAIAGIFIGLRYVKPKTRARNQVERVVQFLMIGCASIAILTTVGIVFSVLLESYRFFGHVPATDFLFGTHWSPQTAMRADQAGSSGAFGAVPLFVGTLLISFIALLVAVPLGLMSAIYLSEYAGPQLRAYAKPAMEVLAGIPTVVYGFFAALTVAPFIRNLGESLGLSVASESALAAGLVMGVMIIPFMSSLSDDVINAVPQSMRDGSYGMGATKSETIKQVILPAALPGIVGAFLLAASRAIGETMIVVMAAGLAANLTINPLESVTTVTVYIVKLLTGDQEFDSAKTLAAFALGLSLFVVTLILNVVALHIVRKYREQYD
ncbi:phosphate ABC transporter permease subunit PstC [Thiothrix subterranea]|uniref:Phosphate transport system permease protein n=2 Tax=Thiothrix subterranea TaxID=2735563 RepID=A0AA51MJT5_9GAMM|nr:phosphate ABC transporter permease subunit PstC [Thiothrix subterranea]MDQ5768068.1 phosphate ABC transporter permease subunit PstC [Thiothrix subterranea]WML85170.1 phosphate ABC transporter permease subunit PstC [Thiothrix subterranea]